MNFTTDLDEADPLVRREPDGLEHDRRDAIGNNIKRVEVRPGKVGLVRVGLLTVEVDLCRQGWGAKRLRINTQRTICPG